MGVPDGRQRHRFVARRVCWVMGYFEGPLPSVAWWPPRRRGGYTRLQRPTADVAPESQDARKAADFDGRGNDRRTSRGPTDRLVSARGPDRRRRDGRSVSRARPEAGTRRRDQSAALNVHGRPRAPGEVRTRSARAGLAGAAGELSLEHSSCAATVTRKGRTLGRGTRLLI